MQGFHVFRSTQGQTMVADTGKFHLGTFLRNSLCTILAPIVLEPIALLGFPTMTETVTL